MSRSSSRSHSSRTAVVALVALASAFLCVARAEAGVRRVWAVNDGEKVERDAREHPARARNTAWDGRRVRVFGARNEIVAFQVIVEADGARRARSCRVRLPALTRAARAHRLPAAGARTRRTTSGGRFRSSRPLHARDGAVARVVGLRRGSPAAPPDPTGMEAGAARAGERARGRGGLPVADRRRTRTRRSGSRSTSIAAERAGATRARSRSRADGVAPGAADRARGLRLHAAGREQHARDAVLREPTAGAVSRPESRRRLSSLRAPPPRRARARLRRDERPGACRAAFRARTSPREAATTVPGEGVGNVIAPAHLLRTGPRVRRPRQRVGAERLVDDVRCAPRCRARSRFSTCRTSRAARSTRASCSWPRTSTRTPARDARCRSS